MFIGSMVTCLSRLAGPHPRSLSLGGAALPRYLPAPRSGRRRSPDAWALSLFALVSAAIAGSCEKVPLLAPSGSTITLTASTNAMPANGTADIIAQVLEPAGTPPHSGTHVIFTTTLGSMQPSEATTDINGRVAVKFMAGGANGTATITASSGGATTGTNGAVKIAVGTAAVGRITLSANPATITCGGGTAVIIANVVDTNGNPLVGVPVNFSTTGGSLASSLVMTDANGNATTSLTTAVEATVTANVGAATGGTGTTSGNSATVPVKVSGLPTVTISSPGGTLTAGTPITFTLSVQPASGGGAQIREVIVSFGDGDTRNLGAVSGSGITVQHLYDSEGTYTVAGKATDTLGCVAQGSTVVVVQSQAPVVTISFTRTDQVTTWEYTFTANVFPSTTSVVSYSWNFGDGTSETTTGNTVSHRYTKGTGNKTVTVTVTRPNGQQVSSSTTITT